MKTYIVIILLLYATMGLSQDKINPNGYNVFYYPNNKKSSEGWMKNGKPDGFWINYYVTGVKKSEGIRRNNLLDSIWVFFTITGDTATKINFLYGRKNGYSYEYYYIESEGRKIMISKELYLNDKKEGFSYYYHDNGKLKEISNYKNGKLDGKRIEYELDGRIVAVYYYDEGKLIDWDVINRYKDGYKNGLWREFYENGNIKLEMNFINDTLHGLIKEYDINGLIKSIIKYENGRIVERNIGSEENENIEVITKTDEKGNVIFKGTYKEGIPIGIHRDYDSYGNIIKTIMYNENGKIISDGIITMEGKKEGEWYYYHDNGNISAKGNYISNEKEGKWEYYYISGKIEQIGYYKKGKESGQWKWYYDNGNMLREENYFNGLNDGLYIEYNMDGKEIAKGDYLEGDREGFWFYEVGDYKEEGSYLGGMKNGEWAYYYKNGQKMFEGMFFQDTPDGKHYYFYENGALKEERFYIMGYKEKTWKRYDEQGNLVMTITYTNNLEEKINGIKIKVDD